MSLRVVKYAGNPAVFGQDRLIAYLGSDPNQVVTCGEGGDTQFLEAPEGDQWVPMPEIRPNVACHIHCAAPSGSGKSTFANLYAHSFKLHTGGRVVVISADAEDDPVLFSIDKRIAIDESLAHLPLENIAPPDGLPTLIIFDDVEGLAKPLATALRVFTQAVKERGRKMGIASLSLYHKGAGGLTTRDSLGEATSYTVWPKRVSSNTEYMLQKYASLPLEIIGMIRRGNWGRWLMVYPGEVLLGEKRIAELDSSVLSAIAKEEKKRLAREAASGVEGDKMGPGSAAAQLQNLSLH